MITVTDDSDSDASLSASGGQYGPYGLSTITDRMLCTGSGPAALPLQVSLSPARRAGSPGAGGLAGPRPVARRLAACQCQ
jgi:hypothetical protein